MYKKMNRFTKPTTHRHGPIVKPRLALLRHRCHCERERLACSEIECPADDECAEFEPNEIKKDAPEAEAPVEPQIMLR